MKWFHRSTLFGLSMTLIIIGLLVGLNFFQIRIFTMMSGSMEPELPVGSIIFTKAQPIEIGQIITFQRQQQITTHRVVSRVQVGPLLRYVTKGDRNSVTDTQLIEQADVLGTYFFKLPYLGYAVDFVHHPLGFGVFVVFPAIVLLLCEAQTLWRQSRK